MTSPTLDPPADEWHWLTADGARLAFRDCGKGPAVALIHGWALDLSMWDAIAEAWKPGFRVIRCDRRGFGGSTGTPDLRQDAADLAALLDGLGIHQVSLVGMSQGARVAVDLAVQRPERVACLVLDGAPAELLGGPKPPTPEIPLAELQLLLRTDGMAAVREALRAHPLLQLHGTDATHRRHLETMLQRYPAADLNARGGDLSKAGPRLDELPSLPVLLVNGEFDSPQRIAAAQAASASRHDTQRAIIAAAGHLAALDNPAGYDAAIRPFLQRHLGALAP